MNNLDGVHKAPKFETAQKTKPENVEMMTPQQDQTSKQPKFNLSKQAASVNYREPLKTDRPKNVYIELIDGNYWLWYNTERSTEVGIIRNFVTDEMTQIKSEFGYDCNIPATKENIALVQKLAFAGTQYIYKDGVRRSVVDIGKFIEEAKL